MGGLTQQHRCGVTTRAWDASGEFHIEPMSPPNEGPLQIGTSTETLWNRLLEAITRPFPHGWRLLILGPGNIFIPQEAMLDLWQAIRSYGFCIPRMMPTGLDALSPQILPIMARLDYLKRVELATPTSKVSPKEQAGLQFIAPLAKERDATSQSIIHVMQPV